MRYNKGKRDLYSLFLIGVLQLCLFSNLIAAQLQTQQYDSQFEGFSDSNTVLLWLFDDSDYPNSNLTDASIYGNADLCLLERGHIEKGKYGKALKTNQPYSVCLAGFIGKVPEDHLREKDGTPSGLWGPTETPDQLINTLSGDIWTVEFWLKIEEEHLLESTIIDLGQSYDPGFSMSINGNNLITKNYYGGILLTNLVNLTKDLWTHIAIVKYPESVKVFVNGEVLNNSEIIREEKTNLPFIQKPFDRENDHRGFKSMDFETRRQNRFNISIGSDRHGENNLIALVDEFRISKLPRYYNSFNPSSFSRNISLSTEYVNKVNGPPLLFNADDEVKYPFQIGSRKYIFIDDAIISEKKNVQFVMNQPYDKQQLKGFTVQKSSWRPSVFDVDGEVFMAIPDGYGASNGIVLLAKSIDGINFTIKDTIITETPLYATFFKDLNPNIPKNEKYKANAFVANRGMYFYVSPDGMKWRRNETIQLPLRSGGDGECYWDDQKGEYFSLIKRDASFNDIDNECNPTTGRVAIGFSSKYALESWSFNKLNTPYFEGYPFPSVTCEGPVIFGITEASQVYRTRAIKYPWAPDLYLAFVWRYPGNNGSRHVDLGVSRDGENWKFSAKNYSNGPWYFPTSSAEEELSIYGLIKRGNEIWQYVDEGGSHGDSKERKYYRYKQRLDGFISVETDSLVGEIITYPLTFKGTQLEINLDSHLGYVLVELLNEKGSPITGYELVNCDKITNDSVNHVISWNGNKDLSELKNKTIQIKFQIFNSKIYAFQFNENSHN